MNDMQSIAILIAGIFLFFGCLIAFIVLCIKRKKKKKIAKDNNITVEDLEQLDKSFLDLNLIDYYDQELKCYVMANGYYMDFFKINTKDLNSASEDELNWDAMKFAKLYKTYADDLKIVTLNYPCNTKIQQDYWRYKLEHTKNPEIRRIQEQKIFQLEWLEKNSTSREFYLMYFAKDKVKLENNRRSILSILSLGKMGMLEEITTEKKHQIIYKVMNKSSHIF